MNNRFPYGDEWGAWHVMHVMVPSGSSGRSFAILFPGAISIGCANCGAWHSEQIEKIFYRKFIMR